MLIRALHKIHIGKPLADPTPTTMTSYDATLGALLIGVLVSGCLWGVSCAQIWHYFTAYRKQDNKYLRILVVVCWITDTAHQGLISQGVYHYTVSIFGQAERLNDNIPSLAIQTVVQEFTAFLVQCFFAHRIYTLSGKNKLLTGGTLLIIFAQLALIIANTVVNYHSSTFLDVKLNNRALTPACVAMSVAADLLLGLTMCTLLHFKRAGTEGLEMFANTNNVIDRLMLFSLGTGLTTSICALALLISYLASSTFAWFSLYFVIGRLYVNSLMVNLNIRAEMRRQYNEDPSYSVRLDGSHRAGGLHVKFPRSPVSPWSPNSMTDSPV